MARDGTLKINVVGDVSSFSKGMQGAGKELTGFSSTAKVAFGVTAGVAAAGFAVMAKGALEMEGAQGKFQAATGASREEAVAFSKDMNALVGNNATVGRSFEEIAAAGTQVAQQFKVSGQEAADLTQDFLAFSKVTGQDAAGAVDSFDAALDAWKLPASAAKGIMDQLVASNQKFGTDAGPAAVKAIADMAPALQAMGMEATDAIGILNLFESAGLDSATAAGGLNRALKNLKPGQTLDDLIVQISSIEDPILRSQEAIRIFGKAAGPGLANAIQPGMTGLSDFEISAEDAADTVDTAAADMVTSADKFKMGFERIGSALRGLGQDFGPLVTGVGAIASGLGPMLGTVWTTLAKTGAWKAAAGAAGAAASAAYQAGMKVADAIGVALSGAWHSVVGSSVLKKLIGEAGLLAGEVYAVAIEVGHKIIHGLHTIWEQALANPLIHSAAAKAGAFAGGIYAAAAGVVNTLLAPLKAAWTAVASSGPMLAAARLAGQASGAAYALGFVGAIALVPVLQDVANKAHDALFGFFSANDPITDYITSAKAQNEHQAAGGTAAANVAIGFAATLAPDLEEDMREAARFAGLASEQTYVNAGIHVGTAMGAAIPPAAATGFAGAFSAIPPEMLRIAEAAHEAMLAAHKEAAWGGAQTPRAFSQGAISTFDTVTDAFDRLKQLMKDTLSPAKQIAELEGIATSRRLAKGLRDGRPEVRGESQQIALDTLAELHKLAPGSAKIGELTTLLLANALPNERPALQDAIALILGTVTTPLSTLPPIGTRTGNQITGNLARALYAGADDVKGAAYNLARVIKHAMLLDSPAKEGPWSERGGPIEWARQAARKITGALAGSVRAGMPDVRAAFAGLPGIGSTGYAALAPAFGGAMGGGSSQGGEHYHFHFHDLALLDEGGIDRLEQRFESRRRLRTRGGARPLGG